MAALSAITKRFITARLACFGTPSEVAKLVSDEFGIEISRSHVQRYDPTTVHGAPLGKVLRAFFFETRKHFREAIDDIPIANKAVRLARLEQLSQKAESKGNWVLAAALLEQASKESGDYWTNRREFSGPGGSAIPITGLNWNIVDPEKK